VGGSIERTAAVARFNHNRALSRCRDESIALQKTPFCGWRSTRKLGYHSARLHYSRKQGIVATGIKPIDSTGKEGDCGTSASKSGTVRHTVNSVCGTGDYGEATIREPGGQFHGHMLAVSGSCSSTHKSNRVTERRGRPRRSAHPQG